MISQRNLHRHGVKWQEDKEDVSSTGKLFHKEEEEGSSGPGGGKWSFPLPPPPGHRLLLSELHRMMTKCCLESAHFIYRLLTSITSESCRCRKMNQKYYEGWKHESAYEWTKAHISRNNKGVSWGEAGANVPVKINILRDKARMTELLLRHRRLSLSSAAVSALSP